MNELKPSTQALLELGRLGDDPTDAAIGKNRSALAMRLGASALGASAIVGSTSKAAASVSTGVWTTLKVGLLWSAALLGGAVAWKLAAPTKSVAATGSNALRASLPAVRVPLPAVSEAAGLVPPASASAALAPVAPRSMASARPPGARSIKEELELVRAAQQQLNRGEPRAALALLDEHARKFPSGVLWEDREASRVFAQCRLGNAAGARALAAAFIRRAPHSPFVDRVRAACSSP